VQDNSKSITIESAATLDATTKLYTVVWRGNHLLVAKTAGHGVAVLSRASAAGANDKEAQTC
jgi:hypothetical protein